LWDGNRGSASIRYGGGKTRQARLAVGDVSARQALILPVTKNPMLRPAAPAARRRSLPVEKTRRAEDGLTSVGLSLPPSAHLGAFLILIVAQFRVSSL
jgi:hypothetical protein